MGLRVAHAARWGEKRSGARLLVKAAGASVWRTDFGSSARERRVGPPRVAGRRRVHRVSRMVRENPSPVLANPLRSRPPGCKAVGKLRAVDVVEHRRQRSLSLPGVPISHEPQGAEDLAG